MHFAGCLVSLVGVVLQATYTWTSGKFSTFESSMYLLYFPCNIKSESGGWTPQVMAKFERFGV